MENVQTRADIPISTSCMVLVRNPNQQADIETWMRSIGYKIQCGNSGDRCFLVADSGQHVCLWLELNDSAREVFARDFIDCEESIDMFKALAALGSDGDREKWFVADVVIRFDRLKGIVQTDGRGRLLLAGQWFKVLVPRINQVRMKWMYCRRPQSLFHEATIEEIIQRYSER